MRESFDMIQQARSFLSWYGFDSGCSRYDYVRQQICMLFQTKSLSNQYDRRMSCKDKSLCLSLFFPIFSAITVRGSTRRYRPKPHRGHPITAYKTLQILLPTRSPTFRVIGYRREMNFDAFSFPRWDICAIGRNFWRDPRPGEEKKHGTLCDIMKYGRSY